MWTRVEGLCARAADAAALRHHGLELIAARLRREGGLPVEHELIEAERRAALIALAVPAVLSRVRDAYDGVLVLMKGPEVAAHYPRGGLRPFCDLDFIADDPHAAHRALRAAGFVEVGEPGEYDRAHHLPPLASPGFPLFVELHREPNRPNWLSPSWAEDLLTLTRPSLTGVEGLSGPVPAAHAILLASHSWAHAPLRRLLDLIDVSVVLGADERALAAKLAQRWGLAPIWRTTIEAADALLRDGRRTTSLRVWGRHLEDVRERTVAETHLAHWAGPTCGLPRTRLRALAGATAIFSQAARPRADEHWPDAIRRTRLAFANAARPQSEHDRIKEASRPR